MRCSLSLTVERSTKNAAPAEVRQRPVSDCQGNRRLAHTASPQNCNQALVRLEPTLNLTNNIVTTDHAAQSGRQVGHSRGCTTSVMVGGKASDRRDEAVALALYARNVLVTELTIAQCLAQRRQNGREDCLPRPLRQAMPSRSVRLFRQPHRAFSRSAIRMS